MPCGIFIRLISSIVLVVFAKDSFREEEVITMAWQTPKTNWVSTEKFNKDDYNRIIGNIAELREIAIQA